MAWAQTIGLELRRDDPVPVGLQLEWGVRSAILTGQLGFGERLPGLRELADEVGVNLNTVRAVYARLETDGLVETRHGAGSFISHQPAGNQLNWLEARARAEQAPRQSGLTPQQLAAPPYGAPAPAPAVRRPPYRPRRSGARQPPVAARADRRPRGGPLGPRRPASRARRR